jgi:hypothetical protein
MAIRDSLAPQPTLDRAFFSAVTTTQTVTVPAACTMVKVLSTNDNLLVKFGATNPTTSNFDDIIPAGSAEYLVVPSTTREIRLLPATAIATTIYVVEK